MDSKLTLRLDEHTIQMAKAHAASRGTSVSKLVEAFFTQLGGAPLTQSIDDIASIPESSVTHRLHGLLAKSGAPEASTEDTNGRTEYRAHLAKKHR
jgi:hypothetical protein